MLERLRRAGDEPVAFSELRASGIKMLPLVPLFARHSLGIAIFSYDGGIVFGLNADRDTMPDLDVLAEGIERSFAELKELTRTRQQHRRSAATA